MCEAQALVTRDDEANSQPSSSALYLGALLFGMPLVNEVYT